MLQLSDAIGGLNLSFNFYFHKLKYFRLKVSEDLLEVIYLASNKIFLHFTPEHYIKSFKPFCTKIMSFNIIMTALITQFILHIALQIDEIMSL